MIERLERQYALRILLLLHERGALEGLGELVRALGVKSHAGASKALAVLTDPGLVKMNPHEGFPSALELSSQS